MPSRNRMIARAQSWAAVASPLSGPISARNISMPRLTPRVTPRCPCPPPGRDLSLTASARGTCVIRLGLGTAVAACVAVLAAGPGRAADAPGVTLYRQASLIDGTGGPTRPGMSVLVEGERIKAVTPD